MPRIVTVPIAIWRLMNERRLGLIAAGVAFFAMLAIFPALGVVLGVFSVLADPGVIEEALAVAAEFLPAQALELLTDQTNALLNTASRTLGLASALAFIVAAWSARLGVHALIQGLTLIYGGNPRKGVWNFVAALAMTLVLVGVGVTAMAAMLIAPVILAILTPFIPVGSWIPLLAETLRWAISIAVLVFGLGIFYRYGPNRPDNNRSPFFSPGLLLALVVWAAASAGFTLYLTHFDRYNELYGSIGAAIVLMLWFYISAYSVLLGAALNYVLEEPEEFWPKPV